jgi:hypothetical protein
MKQFAGLLRVLGLAVVLLLLALAITVKQAEAHLVEALRGFGAQLAGLDGMKLHSEPRRLVVNGLELGVVTASTSLSVKDALDRFEGVCQSVGKLDLPATVKQQLERAAGSATLRPNGILREEAESEGFLACLDLGARTDGEGILSRLGEFGRTKQLSSLGQLRFALARRRDDRTSLLMFWTEGDAQISNLFPKTRDALGRDLDDVPRPADSQRLLSALEQGKPFGLVLYRIVGKSQNEVVRSYRALLTEQGWQLAQESPGGVLVARKGDRTVLVRAAANRADKVIVTLSDLG